MRSESLQFRTHHYLPPRRGKGCTVIGRVDPSDLPGNAFPVFIQSRHREADTPVLRNEVLQNVYGILLPLVLPEYACKQASNMAVPRSDLKGFPR